MRFVRSENAASKPGYRRSFSTLGCPGLDLAGVSSLARRFGVHDLELRALAGRLDLPSYFTETDPSLDQTRALLARAGQHIHVLGTSVRLLPDPNASPGDDRMAELKAFGALAHGLGTPWLRVFDGGLKGSPPAHTAGWAPALELLETWDSERSRRGWHCELLIETHTSLLRAGAVLDLIRRAGRPVHILWDAHHTWREGRESLEVTWSQLHPWVRHIHVKDDLPVAGSLGYSYVLPGKGTFPFAELEALLWHDGYEALVSLEWERHWHPSLPPLEDALLSWLR